MTNIKGTRILKRIRAVMLNGEKMEMKHRTHVTSKEFKLAMLPVPKNDRNT